VAATFRGLVLEPEMCCPNVTNPKNPQGERILTLAFTDYSLCLEGHYCPSQQRSRVILTRTTNRQEFPFSKQDKKARDIFFSILAVVLPASSGKPE